MELEACLESPVSPNRRRTSVPPTHTIEDTMPPRAPRPSAEETKSKALSKVWYEFQTTRGPLCKFATWNEYLSEFSVDFLLMWNTIVSKELHARSALSQWRTHPCKRIGTSLPSAYASWSDFLARGGIPDASTGAGSLSDSDRNHFWNDQCSCHPACWHIPSFMDHERVSAPASKRKREDCACTAEPCVCDASIPRSWNDELTSLRNMRRVLPFGGKAFDARIAELENKVARGDAPPPPLKVRDVLKAQSSLDSERTLIRHKASEQEELARKCFSFWWSLEQQYAIAMKKAPSSSVEMLRWFWEGRDAFVASYRKRMGRSALSYL